MGSTKFPWGRLHVPQINFHHVWHHMHTVGCPSSGKWGRTNVVATFAHAIWPVYVIWVSHETILYSNYCLHILLRQKKVCCIRQAVWKWSSRRTLFFFHVTLTQTPVNCRTFSSSLSFHKQVLACMMANPGRKYFSANAEISSFTVARISSAIFFPSKIWAAAIWVVWVPPN